MHKFGFLNWWTSEEESSTGRGTGGRVRKKVAQEKGTIFSLSYVLNRIIMTLNS